MYHKHLSSINLSITSFLSSGARCESSNWYFLRGILYTRYTYCMYWFYFFLHFHLSTILWEGSKVEDDLSTITYHNRVRIVRKTNRKNVGLLLSSVSLHPSIFMPHGWSWYELAFNVSRKPTKWEVSAFVRDSWSCSIWRLHKIGLTDASARTWWKPPSKQQREVLISFSNLSFSRCGRPASRLFLYAYTYV